MRISYNCVYCRICIFSFELRASSQGMAAQSHSDEEPLDEFYKNWQWGHYFSKSITKCEFFKNSRTHLRIPSGRCLTKYLYRRDNELLMYFICYIHFLRNRESQCNILILISINKLSFKHNVDLQVLKNDLIKKIMLSIHSKHVVCLEFHQKQNCICLLGSFSIFP